MKDLVITRQTTLNRWLHHVMSIVGGYFAGYAILTRMDFLGNAQTSNVIYMVMAICGHNFKEVLFRIIGILIYMSAGILFVAIKRFFPEHIKPMAFAFDTAAIISLGFIPEDTYVVIALYPIFFAMSFQWNAFPGEYGYKSSTIFATNNTRQVSLALGEYIFDHDKRHLHRLGFFLGSLVSFSIGVASAYFSEQHYGVCSIWFNMVYILLAIVIFFKMDILCNKKKNTEVDHGTKGINKN